MNNEIQDVHSDGIRHPEINLGMNPGNFAHEPNARKKGWVPDYETKDYVFCDLCKWIERIPEFGENKHWRNLCPVSLEEIQKKGVDSYEYESKELRQEIISKIKTTDTAPVLRTLNFMEALDAAKQGKRIRRKDWIFLFVKVWENGAIALYNEGQKERVDALLNIADAEAEDWMTIE
jgi:hypothetical protein